MDNIKPKYVSIFSGKDIDELLSSIPRKLDRTQDLISNVSDFDTLPELENQAGLISSDLVYDIIQHIYNAKFAPDNIRDLVESATDSNTFTDAESAKLASVSGKWLEPVADITARDAIITSGFAGGEAVVVKDAGQGRRAIFIWNNSSQVWVDALKAQTGTLSGSIGSNTIVSVDKTTFNVIKCIINADSATNIHTVEVLLHHDGGGNVSVTTYGEMSSTDIMTVDGVENAGNIDLNVTLTEAATITWHKISEF